MPQTLIKCFLSHPIQCLKLECGHELPGELVKWKFRIQVWVEHETSYCSGAPGADAAVPLKRTQVE